MSEACRACVGPQKVRYNEDIPLCNEHWNAFLAKYVGYDAEHPPCAAHLIREGEES